MIGHSPMGVIHFASNVEFINFPVKDFYKESVKWMAKELLSSLVYLHKKNLFVYSSSILSLF